MIPTSQLSIQLLSNYPDPDPEDKWLYRIYLCIRGLCEVLHVVVIVVVVVFVFVVFVLFTSIIQIYIYPLILVQMI